ncbi:5-formyltetrahydrofolate cyclo-ligase [Lichenicoccus sp.]|uniref:5-formyltetrahydrofolate cyclo-ligase n=1 Tax=Lichenicoccus sp. TaxID=2781899 RepID=UPI003D0A7D5E
MAAPHLIGRDAKRRMRDLMRHRASGDDAALIASLLAHVPLRGDETVAGVWPLPGEPDLRPLWQRLHAAGIAIVLPFTPPLGQALRFRSWVPGCTMQAGRFGTEHPRADADASPPDLLFVPLLAFDRHGFRLGHGGGYYDRTLAALPSARSVGYGFASQQVEAVPRGPHDMKLDCIVTERGCVTIEG